MEASVAKGKTGQIELIKITIKSHLFFSWVKGVSHNAEKLSTVVA